MEESNLKGKVGEETKNRLWRNGVGKFHHIGGINITFSMKISVIEQKLRSFKCMFKFFLQMRLRVVEEFGDRMFITQITLSEYSQEGMQWKHGICLYLRNKNILQMRKQAFCKYFITWAEKMDNLKKLGDKSFSHPTIFWLSPNFCPYLWIFWKSSTFWQSPKKPLTWCFLWPFFQ